MKKSRFCSAVLILVSVVTINVLVGCATDKAPQTETLSKEEFRRLYPRQYYESASPSERQEMDRQEQEKQWREKEQ
jgi:hypothetical protein